MTPSSGAQPRLSDADSASKYPCGRRSARSPAIAGSRLRPGESARDRQRERVQHGRQQVDVARGRVDDRAAPSSRGA